MNRLVFALTAGVVALVAPSASAASLKAPSCLLVSSAKLTHLLGVQIVSVVPMTDGTPGQTACGYSTNIISDDATIIYTAKAGKTVYAIDKAHAGKTARPVPGLSGAFSFSLTTGVGNGLEPGMSLLTGNSQFEVDLLEGNVEVRVNAYAPLAKVEAVAKTVSASL
jgi:hypothetical protein